MSKSNIPQRVNDGGETGPDRSVHQNFQRFPIERDSVQVGTKYIIDLLKLSKRWLLCSEETGQNIVFRREPDVSLCAMFPCRDIFPILKNPLALTAVIDLFEEYVRNTHPQVDLIVGKFDLMWDLFKLLLRAEDCFGVKDEKGLKHKNIVLFIKMIFFLFNIIASVVF